MKDGLSMLSFRMIKFEVNPVKLFEDFCSFYFYDVCLEVIYNIKKSNSTIKLKQHILFKLPKKLPPFFSLMYVVMH